MQGYLLQGDPGIDRRGTGLEHAVVEAGWRINETWGATVAVGQHGTDQSHVEAAWVQAQRRYGPDDWLLIAGRQRPELGPVLTMAGHMDRFAMVPLAKRVAVNDDWIDDGLQFGWRRDGLDLKWSVDAGLWNGQVFPGASNSAMVPSLHTGVALGDWNLDGFYARFEPKGRGAVITSSTGAHSHSAPVCDALLKQIVCFDGASELTGASLRWNSHDWPVTASLAGWMRRDSGVLQSANGIANYTGDNQGAWADVTWRFLPRAEVGVRVENLYASHNLHGAGASLVASEAGFGTYKPANRSALMVAYLPSENLEIRFESGEEDVAGIHGTYTALRATVKFDYFWESGR